MLALGGGLVFFLGQDNENTEPSTRDLTNEPELSIQNAQITDYDSDGRKLYDIQVENIEQYLDDSAVYIKQYSLRIDTEIDQTYTLNADQGEIHADLTENSDESASRVELIGNVRMESVERESGSLSIAGDRFTYLPEERVLTSNQPVTIQSKERLVQAGSVHFDLVSGLIDISSSADQRVHIEVHSSEN